MVIITTVDLASDLRDLITWLMSEDWPFHVNHRMSATQSHFITLIV